MATIATVTKEGCPNLRIDDTPDGGCAVFCETTEGEGARGIYFRPFQSGGGWELRAPGNLPPQGSGFEVKPDGHVVVHEE